MNQSRGVNNDQKKYTLKRMISKIIVSKSFVNLASISLRLFSTEIEN